MAVVCSPSFGGGHRTRAGVSSIRIGNPSVPGSAPVGRGIPPTLVGWPGTCPGNDGSLGEPAGGDRRPKRRRTAREIAPTGDLDGCAAGGGKPCGEVAGIEVARRFQIQGNNVYGHRRP